MPQTLAQVQCPQCKAPAQVALQQIIDAKKDPAAKARLLSNALNILQCRVCGFEGQLGAPLVYHDQEKELLLTFVPPELGMNKDDQERALGRLISSVMEKLAPEERKGYLLQPIPMFTRQSLVERVLEGDGVTREQIEEQRERMRLFEQMMNTPEEDLVKFVAEHDKQIDGTFLQLANLSIQSIRDPRVREFAGQRLSRAIEFSSLGKEIMAQENNLREAARTLQEAGRELTQERLLEIVLAAPDEQRVVALVSLARPGFDYTFFQLLSERIEKAEGKEQERLKSLRERILKQAEELDEIQKERLAMVSGRLQALVEADDLDEALGQTLPYVDDLFISILQASLQAARERNDTDTFERLEEIDKRLSELIRAAMPPGLLLVQELLEMEDPEKARQHLEQSSDRIDEQFMATMTSAIQRVEEAGEEGKAAELMDLYRLGLKLSMRKELKKKPSGS